VPRHAAPRRVPVSLTGPTFGPFRWPASEAKKFRYAVSSPPTCFGGVGVGDPAADVIAAWSVFGPAGRAAFRSALDVDDGT
jgi:hypothetical protein